VFDASVARRLQLKPSVRRLIHEEAVRRTLFDADAPWTVRAAAVCLTLETLLDFVYSLFTTWSGSAPNPRVWRGVVRPLIGLSAGLAWSWGIAQMLGVFYWGWVVVMALVAIICLVTMILAALGLESAFAAQAWSAAEILGLVLVVASFILLVSKPSLRAYWQKGRLVLKKSG
jgi:hypothetical protein